MNKSDADILRSGVRNSFPLFVELMKGDGFLTDFHLTYYKILNRFANGDIKRLIISVPPQHGKSEGSTRLLPAYLFGINPCLRIAIASYNDRFAWKFNRDIQRIMETPIYRFLFPDTHLPCAKDSAYQRTTSYFDIVSSGGSLLAVGRGGALTGNPVDVLIMDDLYKDAEEGNSPVIRDYVWEWYNAVAKTRMHNDSQELIVFTRWHEDDLIGRILEKENVVQIESLSDISDISPSTWIYVNFEAIKDSQPTEIDPRRIGEALWPERHNIESLKEKRQLDPIRFSCMYQGDPSMQEGLLYGREFLTYQNLPKQTRTIANYTDTADTGTDYLCSICYMVDLEGNIFITDVLYTQSAMEETEYLLPKMLRENNVRIAYVESNNGGRGFARTVQQACPDVRVIWFTQRGNKESRILTNSATVLQKIRFPEDWAKRWPEFYNHLITFKRVFRANRHDDAPDALTGIVEKEVIQSAVKGVRVRR